MKVLFHGKTLFLGSRSIVMLFIVQLFLLSSPALAQEQDRGRFDNKKILYGIHLGFTANNVDLYYTQGGAAHALEEGNHSFAVPGFSIATMFDVRLGNYFSLRAMPGVTCFGHIWEPGNISVFVVPSGTYKVKSVLGELPVDVKFHPFRMGKWQPYITSGLSYGFDFGTLRDSDNEDIQRLNGHDLRYTCGLGIDCDTRYLRVGVELKAGFGLLSPNTDGTDHSNTFYFHGGPTFSIGFNIEA